MSTPLRNLSPGTPASDTQDPDSLFTVVRRREADANTLSMADTTEDDEEEPQDEDREMQYLQSYFAAMSRRRRARMEIEQTYDEEDEGEAYMHEDEEEYEEEEEDEPEEDEEWLNGEGFARLADNVRRFQSQRSLLRDRSEERMEARALMSEALDEWHSRQRHDNTGMRIVSSPYADRMRATTSAEYDESRSLSPSFFRQQQQGGEWSLSGQRSVDASHRSPNSARIGGVSSSTHESAQAFSKIILKNFPQLFADRKLIISSKMKQRTVYGKILSQLGGKLTDTVSDCVDFGIFEYKDTSDPEWKHCEANGVEILTPQWIDACLQAKKLIRPYKCCIHWPVFRSPTGIMEMQNLVISVTGFVGEERSDLKHLIRLCGATYSGALSKRENTHLICCQPFGEKYRKALEWRISVINKKWLYDCIASWKLLPEDAYRDVGVLR